MIRPQAEVDQGAGVRDGLVLPSVIRLVAAHGGLGCVVPFSRGLAIQVMLANERFLNLLRAPGVDGGLSAPF